MKIDFLKYELPLLQALVELGGQARTKSVYPVIEKILGINPKNFPEEYETYKSGAIKWKNKTAWAREYLKRKGQLDGSVRGIWRITEAGKERIEVFLETRKDPDEGLAQIQGVETALEENEDISPEEGFDIIENIQAHETGGILGVRGIVYEPINEQGVILLFAALCHDLGFMIEAIRASFPDALLRRKNHKGTWNSCRAEFEFRSSNFKIHKHDPNQCDIIICWEDDWRESPLEVLCLKAISREFK